MPRIAKAIHVVEKREEPHLRCINPAEHLWQTGYWVVADSTAESLLGGMVYVHRGQNLPSHKGGEILDLFHEPGSESKRKIIVFRAMRSAEGVVEKKGWGNERKIVWEDAAARNPELQVADDGSAFPEGKKRFEVHARRERDSALIRRAKGLRLLRTGKLACEICGFDFAARFGAHGEGYIEAHHTVPISQLDGKTRTRVADLALVCSNCHRMLHRVKPLPTPTKLKTMQRRP